VSVTEALSRNQVRVHALRLQVLHDPIGAPRQQIQAGRDAHALQIPPGWHFVDVAVHHDLDVLQTLPSRRQPPSGYRPSALNVTFSCFWSLVISTWSPASSVWRRW
jgi:hypothetical protein